MASLGAPTSALPRKAGYIAMHQPEPPASGPLSLRHGYFQWYWAEALAGELMCWMSESDRSSGRPVYLTIPVRLGQVHVLTAPGVFQFSILHGSQVAVFAAASSEERKLWTDALRPVRLGDSDFDSCAETALYAAAQLAGRDAQIEAPASGCSELLAPAAAAAQVEVGASPASLQTTLVDKRACALITTTEHSDASLRTAVGSGASAFSDSESAARLGATADEPLVLTSRSQPNDAKAEVAALEARLALATFKLADAQEQHNTLAGQLKESQSVAAYAQAALATAEAEVARLRAKSLQVRLRVAVCSKCG